MSKTISNVSALTAVFILLLSCKSNAKTPYLTVTDASNAEISAIGDIPAAGCSFTLNVLTNDRWVASFSESWLSAKKKSGDGDGVLEVSVEENNTPEVRTAEILVLSTAGPKQKVQVTQDRSEKSGFVTLKIMTFNILEGDKIGSSKEGKEGYEWERTGRRDRVIAMLGEEKPDILCLQECRRTQLNDLKSAMPDYIFYDYAKDGVLKDGSVTDFSANKFGNPTDDTSFKNGGQRDVIAFKKSMMSVDEWGAFWISETPMIASKYKDTGGQKLSLWVKMTLTGFNKQIAVCCTHHIPSSYKTEATPDVLTPSAEINVQELKKVIKDTETLFYMGDLNTNDTSPQMQPINDWLKSARQNCSDTDERSTYQSGTRLDHIYYMNATPLKFKGIDCTMKPDDTSVTTYGLLSDHRPVYANFVIAID